MAERVAFSLEPATSWNQFPRPGEVRVGDLHQWQSLNGVMGLSLSRVRRHIPDPKAVDYDRQVVIPYPVGSYLSGVEETGVLLDLAYQKAFFLPDKWFSDTQRLFLHVDGADYASAMRVNDSDVLVTHKGGYTPFQAEITSVARPGENRMYLQVIDDMADPLQPKGKQSALLYERGCMYAPMAGINGPVWLQALPPTFIDGRRYYPSFAKGDVGVNFRVDGDTDGLRVETIVYADDRIVGTASSEADGRVLQQIALDEIIPYDPIHEGSTFRYSIDHVLYQRGGKTIDHVKGYFGLRDIGRKDGRMTINGAPIPQYSQILYQGFHPESLYRPPHLERTEEHAKIIRAMGFDGIRYHQNVPHPLEMEVFDREGVLVALEYPDWGAERSHPGLAAVIIDESKEAVMEHFNSPAVVIVCKLNEAQKQHPVLNRTVYARTKGEVGHTRLVKDVSGFERFPGDPTDIISYHHYARGGAGLRRALQKMKTPDPEIPVFLDEFGGVAMEVKGVQNDREGFSSGQGWGYGAVPRSMKAAFRRFQDLVKAVRESDVAAFCWTQYNHTGKERNGLACDLGNPIFPVEVIREVIKEPTTISLQEAPALTAE